MKKNLLFMSALLVGAMTANAQSQNVTLATSANTEAMKPVFMGEKPQQMARPLAARTAGAPLKAASNYRMLYSMPKGTFYYGLSDNGYNFNVAQMLTGAFDDVVFENYCYDNENKQGISDVEWHFYYEENGVQNEEEPLSKEVDENGSLIAQAFGFMNFPTVSYNGQEFTYTIDEYDDDGNVTEQNPIYWRAGSDSIVRYNFSGSPQDGGIFNACVQLGFYSGFGNGLDFTNNHNFYTTQDYATTGKFYNTGKKLKGFVEHYDKPVSFVYAQEIVAWFWTKNIDTTQPFNGNELSATIFTINEDGQMELYAEAVATESDLTLVGTNGLAYISYKFMEEDPILGAVEGPITLPDSEFIVVLDGFDALQGTFTAPFASADGWQGHAYALLEDDSMATIGYSNNSDMPQINLFIGFRAALPVAVPYEGNLEAIQFSEKGGIGLAQYDEATNQGSAYAVVYTMSGKNQWEAVELPAWVTYEIDDSRVNQGVVMFTFNAEPLPEGIDSREGEAIFSLYGREVTFNLLQYNVGTGIDDAKTAAVSKLAPAYNLAGQRVFGNYKGLYIVDGHKYFNK